MYKNTIIDNFAKLIHKEDFAPKVKTHLKHLANKNCNAFVIDDPDIDDFKFDYNKLLKLSTQNKREKKVNTFESLFDTKKDTNTEDEWIKRKKKKEAEDMEDSFDSKIKEEIKIEDRVIKRVRNTQDPGKRRTLDINNIFYHLFFRKENLTDKKKLNDFTNLFLKKQ